MAAENNITGDKIISKVFSAQGRENYDAIFRKPNKELDMDNCPWLILCPACGKRRGRERAGAEFCHQNICFACYHVWDN